MDLYLQKKAKVEQIIGYLLLTIGIFGIIGFYATHAAVVVFVFIGLLGVGFEALGYMRKIPKESRPYVADVLRGYVFSIPARWIENVLGFKEGNSDL